MTSFNDLKSTKICVDYDKPSDAELQLMMSKKRLCEIPSHPRIILENTYFKNAFPGTMPGLFLREYLVDKLFAAIKLLPNNLGLIIFDAFRSIETQEYIFESMKEILRAKHPSLNDEDLVEQTKNFAAFPFRSPPPPHSTGGALDLGIINLETNSLLDFGTDFDDPSEESKTNHFENSSNMTVKENRRLLFNLMKEVGFTNYHNEWWHYDLGDFAWSKRVGHFEDIYSVPKANTPEEDIAILMN